MEYFVSYAWGDDTEDGREREVFVNRLCDAAAAKGVAIIRDKTAMHPGDRISKFMERIGRGDGIFVFLSDKYLKSTYCMTELFDVWRNCRQEDSAFIERTRIYVLPCAKIATLAERTQYVLHWRADRLSPDGDLRRQNARYAEAGAGRAEAAQIRGIRGIRFQRSTKAGC